MIAIHSNNILLPQGTKSAFVLIDDGKIKDIVSDLPFNHSYELIEVGNKVLMPGVIDPHIHINEPGRTDWEGFDTATTAAIAGGLTTLIDMPLNSAPVTTTVAAFEEKLDATKDKLHTNVGFWGGIIPGNTDEIEGLIAKGILGFKAFLTHSGIDDFPNATEEDLRIAMPIIAKHNLPLLGHCELTDELLRATGDNRSYQNYMSSRPKEWEDEAITMMIRLCEEFNCRVHIVHLSSAKSIEQIIKAKEKGLPITVESAQHYLYFNAETINDGQTQFKCAPPIREKENNDQLWQALKDGVIDLVATDHSPSTPTLKELESGDFMKAWGGIASLQLALPVLWTKAREKGFTIDFIAKWLCENPAKLIGKSTTKGKIAIGYDADLIVVDIDSSFVVTENMLHHKHKTTPYLNETLYGIVEQTYLFGEKVYDNSIFTQLNYGKIILSK